MNLEAIVSRTDSLLELGQIADKAEPKLSFWGARYLCVQGYQDTLHIDSLADRVIELHRKKQCEYTKAEREVGRILSQKINHLYDLHYTQLWQANYLTRILVILRDIPSCVYCCFIKQDRLTSVNWYGVDYTNGMTNVFSMYTRSQFKEEFGFYPEESEQNGCHRSAPDNLGLGIPIMWDPPHRK